jgi:uncharacterized protein (DUF697 family)
MLDVRVMTVRLAALLVFGAALPAAGALAAATAPRAEEFGLHEIVLPAPSAPGNPFDLVATVRAEPAMKVTLPIVDTAEAKRARPRPSHPHRSGFLWRRRCMERPPPVSERSAAGCGSAQPLLTARMTIDERTSIALIALSAAFCDGRKTDEEREQIRALLDNLEVPDATGLIQRVLLKRAPLAETAAALASPESRALAYEMAVCIIEADGHRNPLEAQFLAELAALLRLAPAQEAQPLQLADQISHAAALPPVDAVSAPPPTATAAPDSALDATIRRTAILAGALELLPQSVATLAVLPLQTHLVYRVGKHHGFALDAGHVKEFIGVLGLGLTSQAFEGLARKFLGGLVRRAGGGLAGAFASAATGPAVTFATTYALGQLAHRYYAGGRTLSARQLKESFQQLLGSARAHGDRLLPEMQARAHNLNLTQLPGLIRGG